MPTPDFTSAYNTALQTDDENRFREWAAKTGRDRDLRDYDMRGWWKENKPTGAVDGHFTDKWKKPNHPTFSNESVYSGRDGEHGGVWSDTSFIAGPSNRRYWQEDDLRAYMRRVEPDTALIMTPSADAARYMRKLP